VAPSSKIGRGQVDEGFHSSLLDAIHLPRKKRSIGVVRFPLSEIVGIAEALGVV